MDAKARKTSLPPSAIGSQKEDAAQAEEAKRARRASAAAPNAGMGTPRRRGGGGARAERREAEAAGGAPRSGERAARGSRQARVRHVAGLGGSKGVIVLAQWSPARV